MEEQYSITPKGTLTLDIEKGLNQMLQEQRDEFCLHLKDALLLMGAQHRDFAVAERIVEALCIAGVVCDLNEPAVP